jgi:hypothetical protein
MVECGNRLNNKSHMTARINIRQVYAEYDSRSYLCSNSAMLSARLVVLNQLREQECKLYPCFHADS